MFPFSCHSLAPRSILALNDLVRIPILRVHMSLVFRFCTSRSHAHSGFVPHDLMPISFLVMRIPGLLLTDLAVLPSLFHGRSFTAILRTPILHLTISCTFFFLVLSVPAVSFTDLPV